VRRRVRIVLGLAPAALVLLVALGGALGGSLLQSLGHAPHLGVTSFPTLTYYRAVLSDPAVHTAALRTLATALPAATLAAVFGTALGLALAGRRGAAGALLQLPLLVPYVVVVALATVWLAGGGVLARVAFAVGAIDGPAGWPRLLDGPAGAGVVLAFAWKQVPFVALLVAAAHDGGDRTGVEVARVFGANRWQTFRYAVLPRVAPALVAAVALVLAYDLGALEVPLLLSGGARDTLAVAAWRAYADPDLAQRPLAMALAWCVLALAAAVVGAWTLAARRWLPGARR
jgi:putative spermidine/putrescine transport system permease protein